MNQSMTELPLKDIHLPDPISFWPLAIGWWIAAAVFMCLILLTLFTFKWLKKTTLKSQAKSSLKAIEDEFLENDDALKCITEISALLRRISLAQDTAKETAGLTGTAWLQFLDKRLNTQEFSTGPGAVLLSGPYSMQVDKPQVSELIQLTSKWVNAL